MDFHLTEEQKSLKALAREFCKKEFPEGPIATWREIMSRRYAAPQDRVPWDWMTKLHKAGFKTLTAPEKYGGGGAGALTAFVVTEELTRMGGAVGIVARQCFSSSELMAAVMGNNPELQDEFIPQDVNNPHFIFGSAHCEAEPNGDIVWPYDESGDVMKTFAYRDGDEYVINGEKAWVTAGSVATVFVLHARTTKNAPVSKSISMFLVPANTPGISVVRNNDVFVPHHFPNACVHFDNVRVPARYLLGEENKGWGWFWKGIFRQQNNLYASDIGQAQALYEYVRDFARQRIAGGKPIIEHGNVGPLISEMAITIEAARLLCYSGCQRLDEQYRADGKENTGTPFLLEATRGYVINAMTRICTLAAEVLAGIGGTSEAPLEAFLLRVYGMYHGEATPLYRLYRAAQKAHTFVPTGYE
jgi:butyryl-CoA dehydrogenase